MIQVNDMEILREHTASWFTSPANLPTSFWCGKEKILGIPEHFSPTEQINKGEGKVDKIYTGIDPKTGLQIETIVTLYDNFPAVDIVTWLTNTGSENTPLLHDILSYDGVIKGTEPYLYTNNGDYCSPDGYKTDLEPAIDQFIHRYIPQGGRSCDQRFPYFKLEFGNNTGMCVAVGWPAQWMAEFYICNGGIHLAAGQETTSMYLLPGEKIRTPKITFVAFEGNAQRGTNVWRRFYNSFVLPKPAEPMLCALHTGGGWEFTEASEKNQLEYLQKAVDSPIPVSAWWIDAGWYECDTPDGKKDWTITGTWRIDKKRFPNGLKPVGDFCKNNGIRMLLWFEPERLRPGTDLEKEHPEWLLYVKGRQNIMLNIGIEECCNWLIDMIDNRIKEYGISIYRQDFNFAPLIYWQENEEYDRRGILENLYVQGFLRFWDTLLERNPGLLIDSCASGGRRNDLETMRRSVPLHPTDFGYGYHPIMQAYARALSTWIPYYRICGERWENEDNSYIPFRGKDHKITRKENKPFDYYSRISFMSPFYAFGMDIVDKDDMSAVKAWEEAAPIMISGDYYPLSKDDRSEDSWFVNEFYSPKKGKGFIQAIRNRTNREDVFNAVLEGIEKETNYKFTNYRTNETFVCSGCELTEKGLKLSIPPRDALVLIFEKAN